MYSTSIYTCIVNPIRTKIYDDDDDCVRRWWHSINGTIYELDTFVYRTMAVAHNHADPNGNRSRELTLPFSLSGWTSHENRAKKKHQDVLLAPCNS